MRRDFQSKARWICLGTAAIALLAIPCSKAVAMETLSMALVGGPLLSSASWGGYDGKPGIIAGALFDLSTGPMAWEFEVLAARRTYETSSLLKVDTLQGQIGAIMRVYLNSGRSLSFGLGPYVAKPLKDQDFVRSDQLELGASLGFRFDTGAWATLGPFAIGLTSDLRFTGGKVISGDSKTRYLDAALLLGLRFGFL